MKNFLILALVAGMLSGCSSSWVKQDFDSSVDFSGLETYAWKHAEQAATGNPKIDNDISDARIRNAIDATLETKGFKRGDPDTADFQVSYFIDFERRLNASSVSFGLGGGRYGRYGGMGYNTSISDYDEGNLTIDIINPQSKKTIWRGVGSRAVYEGSNPEKATRIINKIVAEVLKGFPPGKE